MNFEQNNQAKLFSIAKFSQEKSNNTSITHKLFELNYKYHSYVFFKKNTNFSSDLKIADKLLAKLSELLAICCKNLYYTL